VGVREGVYVYGVLCLCGCVGVRCGCACACAWLHWGVRVLVWGCESVDVCVSVCAFVSV